MDLNEELWNLVKECQEDTYNTLLTIGERHGRLHVGAKLEHLLARHNAPRPRTCGDCGWWERYQEPGDLAKFGSCTHPLPVCLKNQAVVAQREDEDTQGCKCFKPRD